MGAFYIPLMAQQDSISIFDCLKAARDNATQKSQLTTTTEINDLDVENLKSTNLPTVSAYGKATYQSEAISVDLPIPGVSGIDVNKFQYNGGVEVDQKIYDGGVAHRSQQLQTASEYADSSRIETEIYQINDKITRSFFAWLTVNKSLDIFKLKEDLLAKREKELKSGVENGVIRKSELDKLEAEILLTHQQVIDIESQGQQALNLIVRYTGLDIGEKTKLYIPDSIKALPSLQRPEYTYFNAEQQKLNKAIALKSTQRLPKLYAFGQLGYSYPSLNFFANEANYYYIVGAKISWNIFDWNRTKRDKQILAKQQDIIDSKKSEFERNMSVLIENEAIQQEKLISLISMDKRIIRKRAAISAASASALSNGVITTADYLEDLNAEIKARLDLENHKIQYQSSIMRQYLLKGIDVEKLKTVN